MAIEIVKSSNDGGNYSTDFKNNQVPATQGNIVETIDVYNNQIKKHYYDKTETRADENALQTSIENIVKQLVSNTSFTNKTADADEGTDDVTALESVSEFTEDSSAAFNESGLIQKINIIANLLSGTVEDKDSKQAWKATDIGNNVGGNPNTYTSSEPDSYTDAFLPNRPVIGMTRADVNYTASVVYDENNKQVLNISGLSDVNGNDLSRQVVLSESQVAEMIKQSVISVLGSYDNQIGAILGYLMFTTDSIPDSFAAVLKNTQNTHINNAPLYIRYYDTTDNTYYIQDLNGLAHFTGEETTEYKFGGSELTDTDKYWKITASSDYKSLNVVGGEDEITYSIPIPQYTISLDFGYASDTTTEVIFKMYMFNSKSITVDLTNNYTYKSDGTAVVEVPLGSRPTINIPEGVVKINNNLFNLNETDSTATLVANDTDQVNYIIQSNQKLYCGYYTVSVNENNGTNNEPLTASGYEGTKITITGEVSYEGHTLSSETANGCSVTNTDGNIIITYTDVTDNIEDSLVWTENKITITYDANDGTSTTTTDTTTYGSDYTVTADDPTLEGYDFEGWEESTSE